MNSHDGWSHEQSSEWFLDTFPCVEVIFLPTVRMFNTLAEYLRTGEFDKTRVHEEKSVLSMCPVLKPVKKFIESLGRLSSDHVIRALTNKGDSCWKHVLIPVIDFIYMELRCGIGVWYSKDAITADVAEMFYPLFGAIDEHRKCRVKEFVVACYEDRKSILEKDMNEADIINGWHRFIEHILSGITSEIQYVDMDTLITWVSMFYTVDRSTECVRKIIIALIRYFIMMNSGVCYIYNVKQIPSLIAYPYNQWIPDKIVQIQEWIRSIYRHIIIPAFDVCREEDNLLRIRSFNRGEVRVVRPMNRLTTEDPDFSPSMIRKMAGDVPIFITVFDPESSPFFPMRNGILEFTDDGKTKFHTDNRCRLITGYTNVTWTENYDYECTEAKEIRKVFEHTFPSPDERVYMMKLYASTLNGKVRKDVFVQQYGDGKGKVMLNNIMLGMLGRHPATVPVVEDGMNVTLDKVIDGLAALVGGHTITFGTDTKPILPQMCRSRFCYMRGADDITPYSKLNCARIKEILAGDAAVTERLYGGNPKCFVPNCLMVMPTRVPLIYTEDTEPMRRRISVVTNPKSENPDENTFPVDVDRGREMLGDPKCWQAMFYTLLPYVMELPKILSEIERPPSVIDATERAFAASRGKSCLEPSGDHKFVREVIRRTFQSEEERLNFLKEYLADLTDKVVGHPPK